MTIQNSHCCNFLYIIKIKTFKNMAEQIVKDPQILAFGVKFRNAMNQIYEKLGVDNSVPFTELPDHIGEIGGGASGPIDSFTGVKEYKSFVEAEELAYMNTRGALLWTKNGVSEGTDGYLLASNGDGSEWDPNSTTITTPTKAGYTLIGACLGNGYWGRVGYAGLTTEKAWCKSSDGAYSFLEESCHKSGWDITKWMREQKNYSTDSIWGLLDADDFGSHMYIPNCHELMQVCNLACDGGHNSGHTFDKNLGNLFSLRQSSYWSASQYPIEDFIDIAFFIYFSDGYTDNVNKVYGYHSFALLHFGA